MYNIMYFRGTKRVSGDVW